MEQYHWVLGKDPKIAAEMLRGYKEIAETKNQMENKRQSLQNEQNKPSKAAAKDSR